MMSKKAMHEAADCLSPGSGAAPCPAPERWLQPLEVIGAELFQRYRKRLMTPGIALEIWRDFPGLSLPDVMLRVHAGRRILHDGDDFHALAAIRSGRWQRYLADRAQVRAGCRDAGDRVSRGLVHLGGLLFVVFCNLSLLSVMSAGEEGGGLLLPGLVCAAGILSWWCLSARDMLCGSAARSARRRLRDRATRRRGTADQRDVAPSV